MVCTSGRKCGVLISIWVVGAVAQTPPAPTGLAVVSATKSQVQLTWTPGAGAATGYVVERKPLNGSYATALNSTGPSAADTTIDAYSTYVYRIRATSSVGQSEPSNEVTVGPPPYGFNRVVALPGGSKALALSESGCVWSSMATEIPRWGMYSTIPTWMAITAKRTLLRPVESGRLPLERSRKSRPDRRSGHAGEELACYRARSGERDAGHRVRGSYQSRCPTDQPRAFDRQRSELEDPDGGRR
jgi:Fibronectin type III domain